MLKPMAAMHSKLIKVHIMGEIRISHCWEGDRIIEILIDWFVPQGSPHTQITAMNIVKMSNVKKLHFWCGVASPLCKSISCCIRIADSFPWLVLLLLSRLSSHNFLEQSASIWLVLLFYETAENYGLQIVPFWLYLLVLLIFDSIWMQNPLSF